MGKAEKASIEIIRHSLSHVLAMAVLDMFPEAKLAIGPAIENGFYYDFDLPRSLAPEDLPVIEKKMRQILKGSDKFEKSEMNIDEALKRLKKAGQIYKAELVSDIKKTGGKQVSFYTTGNFVDLCAGPHVASVQNLKNAGFKLTSIAGAYWKGSEKNKMLQRIYAVAFENQEELNGYLEVLESAKKHDHRKLGQELGLFTINETVGKGLPLWLPKGAILRQALERFIEDEETKRGYQRTYTPVLGSVNLYKISGHWDHYKDDMYPAMDLDGEEYVLRPMTCPHQFMIYKNDLKSYKDLPVRYAELAEMYRREKSGELSGLTRVMGFTLNDAHIFCTLEQLEKEFLGVLDLIQYSLKKLGLAEDVWYRASLRDKSKSKYISNEKLWEESEKTLIKILKKAGIKYEVGVGDAAFYGPKADIQIKNYLGKEETIMTVQIDLNSADRFDMSYIDKDGERKRPVVIHRAAIGCIERTVAFLLEKHAGYLPVWLAPIQASLITVGGGSQKYAKEIFKALKNENVRVELKDENESVGRKIREAELQKIPYILVVGDKEVAAKSVAVRTPGNKNIKIIKTDKFIEDLKKKISSKK